MAWYPAQIAKLSTAFRAQSARAVIDPVTARALNETNAELLAIQAELGVDPSGAAATVADRIAAAEGASGIATLASAPRVLIPWRTAAIASGAGAGTYMLTTGTSSTGPSAVAAGSANSSGAPFYFDPADYPAIAGLTKKLRLRGAVITNAVAPGINFTFKLLPVATWGGASGALPTVATLGADAAPGVAGQTITAPVAGGPSALADSGLFNAPAAGWYVLGFTTSGANAANSLPALLARLEFAYA